MIGDPEGAGPGDRRQALERLCQLHRPWLTQKARRLVGARFDAEDLVQETLTYFCTQFPEQQPSEGHARAYLARVLTNKFINRIRDSHVRARAAEDPAMEETMAAPAALQDTEHSWANLTREDLDRALDSLSSTQREVLELKLNGSSYRQIAEQLGISEGAVGKRAFDARQRLRKCLLEQKPNQARTE